MGDNVITETLLKRLNARGNIHCVPACLKDKYVIRFTVTSPRTTLDDIITDWKEIVRVADDVLSERADNITRQRVPLGDTKEKNENFGTSLLLSNSPMSPKIVNGSFAAIYDQSDVLAEYNRTIRLRQNAQDSPGKRDYGKLFEIDLVLLGVAMRRRIRGILMSGKQFSLDSRLDLFHGIETPTEDKAVSNLPVLEDTNEIDEKSSSPSGSVCFLWGCKL